MPTPTTPNTKKTATKAAGAKVVPIKAKPPTSSSSSSAAATVAADIRARPYGYDRKKLAAFQRQAGVAVDGLYGPETRRALQRSGVANPPPISFKGATKKPAGSDLTTWLLIGGAAWLLLRKKH